MLPVSALRRILPETKLTAPWPHSIGSPRLSNLAHSKCCWGVVQSLSRVQLFETKWTTACQAPLSSTISLSLLKVIFIELVMPSNHLILCTHFSFCLPSFTTIRVFPNESVLRIRCIDLYVSLENELSMNYPSSTNLLLIYSFHTPALATLPLKPHKVQRNPHSVSSICQPSFACLCSHFCFLQ